MTELEKIALLEDMLEVEEGSLSPETNLEDIEDWDSVAVISFIALVDDTFNKTVKAAQLKEFTKISDLLSVMEF